MELTLIPKINLVHALENYEELFVGQLSRLTERYAHLDSLYVTHRWDAYPHDLFTLTLSEVRVRVMHSGAYSEDTAPRSVNTLTSLWDT